MATERVEWVGGGASEVSGRAPEAPEGLPGPGPGGTEGPPEASGGPEARGPGARGVPKSPTVF